MNVFMVKVMIKKIISFSMLVSMHITFFISSALVISSYEEKYAFANDKAPVVLDKIIVTAVKDDASYTSTGDVNKETTPVFFSVVDRNEFSGKAETVASIIEKETGVQVRESGGIGSFSTISIRGFSADQVTVYLDGIKLNDASGGGVNLENLSVSDIEAIEIYRGAAPAYFPDAAMGGVVNIKTRSFDQKTSARVSAGYGSFHTIQSSFFASSDIPGDINWLLSGNFLNTKNNFKIRMDNNLIGDPSDDTWETRKNAYVRRNNFLAKVSCPVTDKISLILMDQFIDKDQGIPNYANDDISTSLQTNQNIANIKIDTKNLWSAPFKVAIEAEASRKKELYDDSEGEIGLGRQKSRYHTNRYGTRLFGEWSNDLCFSAFSMSYSRESYRPENLLDPDDIYEKSIRNQYSASMETTFFLLEDSLLITPGLRYQKITDERKGDIVWGSNNISETYSHDDIGLYAGAKILIADNIILKSNFSRQVRYPSFFELFGSRGLFEPNPDLLPERSINFDAGITWNTSLKNFDVTNAKLGFIFFDNNIDQMITRVYDARGIGKSVNIGKARVRGFESEADFEIGECLRFILRLTFTDAKNLSTLYKDNQIPNIFKYQGFAKSELTMGNLKIYAEFLHCRGNYYDSANLLETDNKNELSAGIVFFAGGWRLSLSAKNITNDYYQDFNGFPMPGRSYFASVSYDILP